MSCTFYTKAIMRLNPRERTLRKNLIKMRKTMSSTVMRQSLTRKILISYILL